MQELKQIKEVSDMRRILEGLQNQTDIHYELCCQSYRIANSVKTIETKVEESPLIQKDPTSMIEYFQSILWRYEKFNRDMSSNLLHLENTLG